MKLNSFEIAQLSKDGGGFHLYLFPFDFPLNYIAN